MFIIIVFFVEVNGIFKYGVLEEGNWIIGGLLLIFRRWIVRLMVDLRDGILWLKVVRCIWYLLIFFLFNFLEVKIDLFFRNMKGRELYLLFDEVEIENLLFRFVLVFKMFNEVIIVLIEMFFGIKYLKVLDWKIGLLLLILVILILNIVFFVNNGELLLMVLIWSLIFGEVFLFNEWFRNIVLFLLLILNYWE